MSQQMQSSQPPVNAIESQMLCEPVFELVFSLERPISTMRVCVEVWCRYTHCIKTLDVVDMLLDHETGLIR